MNSKCRMCGKRDETVNHIVSECSKLAQREYKTRHDWVGKVIHWELCKKLNFHHATKWYMHKPESVLENETHKILWDFEIQTDPLITARRPDLVLINKKKKLSYRRFCRPGRPRSKTEGNWKERQILGPGQKTEKTVEHEGESCTNSNWCPGERSPKVWKRAWANWKLKEELRLSKQQLCWNQQE